MPEELFAIAARRPLPGQRAFDWYERDLAAAALANPVPPRDEWPWIPTLDPAMQAEGVPAPVHAWGSRGHTLPNPGTYHFYTDDRRFSSVWDRPEMVPASGCVAAVEVNYTTLLETPKAGVLWTVYRKRVLAAYWQQCGVRILVDLNLHPAHHDLALVGVPRGWRAYATRVHIHVGPDEIEREHARCAAHAGTDDLLFVVFGGRRKTRRRCERRGWVHVPEHMDCVRGRMPAYG